MTEFSGRAERLPVAASRKITGATAAPRRKEHIRHAAVADILLAAEQVFARAGFSGATMAEIADRAGLPKANLHYYFRTKAALYRAVLDHTLTLWLAETDGIRRDAHPATALGDYIRAKMRLTATHPDASRVFANEMLHGAPQIGSTSRPSSGWKTWWRNTAARCCLSRTTVNSSRAWPVRCRNRPRSPPDPG